MGRKSKDNPNWEQRSPVYEKYEKDWTLLKFFEYLKTGMSRWSAMAMLDMSPSTVRYWLDTDENFRLKVEAHEEMWIGFVENKKAKLIDKGYRPAIEKELKSKKRDVYGDRIEQDSNIKFDWNIVVKTPLEENP